MRLIYFLGGLAAGLFTVFRIPRAPQIVFDVLDGGDYEKLVAVTFFSISVLTGMLAYVCVKKTFPPPSSKE